MEVETAPRWSCAPGPEEGWSLVIFCARATRGLRRVRQGSLVVLLLAERARSEGARSTRALEDQPGYPVKREACELGRIHVGHTQWRISQLPSLK